MIVAALVATLCILVSVTVRVFDPDVWQHLVIGRAIFETWTLPTREIWSWPTYGAPEVHSSWGFSAFLWPFWAAGGTWGLAVWRWVTTLAAFSLLWATARRMGARGTTPLLVLVLCALTYRQRAQIRPETLAAPLMALLVFVLETRRHRGQGDPRPLRYSMWLIGIAWVWANVHVSCYLGFLWAGFHLVDDLLSAPRKGPAPAARGARSPLMLAGVMLAALAISFLNPVGWRALWQPFAYLIQYRHEPIYRGISEQAPISWTFNLRNGLPGLFLLWPTLAVWRWRRLGPDWVELLACVVFSGHLLLAQRFVGIYVLAAAPYLARDLDLWISARPWPAWTRPAWARAGLTAAACMAASLPELARPGLPLGIAPDWARYPVRACDFMERYGVRGRGFTPFDFGGYMLWRFWPDRERLPFMDIHQSGTRRDRDLSARADDPAAWRELDGHYRFDYVLARRATVASPSLLDRLDGDPDWAMVFADDAAALYLRRDGPLADLASQYAYGLNPGGTARLAWLGNRMESDPTLRMRVAAELLRETRESRWHARALSRLARLALFEGRYDDARRAAEGALRISPRMDGENARLGVIALAQGRPRDALAAFRRERAISPRTPGLDRYEGQAWRRLGDPERARAAFARAVARDPGDREAGDSLRGLRGPSR